MKTIAPSSFGAWLKWRRKSLDLTQVELAQQVGCAAITIQKIEANQRRPSQLMARRLADQLQIAREHSQAFINFARRGAGKHRFGFYQPDENRDFWPGSCSPVTYLPARLTRLVGRDQEITQIRKRLLDDETRLLTLVGPPGVGKTQLAIQSAAGLIGEFEQGVCLVPLASIRDPDLVPETIAQTLGVNQIGERSFADRLIDYLRDKQMLLVLDNFEHVLPAAPFVVRLLVACPWLSILATSRVPLSIRGERRFLVPPLTLPPKDKAYAGNQNLIDYASVQLFVERSQDVNPNFSLTDENADAVAAICTHLDGLPLAIELVASRVGFQPVQSLLEQIQGGGVLYIDGLCDVSVRHRTLCQAIEWSYALLTAEEKRLLTRLSIFDGGWEMDAAASLMPDHPPRLVQNALRILVNHHLVVVYEHKGLARYTLLETIHAYAIERLAANGEEDQIRQWHAEYYLSLAQVAEPNLRTGKQQTWLERLDIERGNLRSALDWFLVQEQDVDHGVQLVIALGWFWSIRCHVSEGRDWLNIAIQKCESGKLDLRIKVLSMAGTLAWLRSDLPVARAFLEESVSLCREMPTVYKWDLAFGLCGLANVLMFQIDHEAVRLAAEESLGLFREIGDQWGIGIALCLLAEAYLLHHDLDDACSNFEAGLEYLRRTGDKWAISAALMDLGYTNQLLGHLDIARAQLEESVVLGRDVGEMLMRAYSHNILAQIALQQGNDRLAAGHYSESLHLLQKMGLEERIAEVLANLAEFVQSHGSDQLADQLYRESLARYQQQRNEAGITRCRTGLAALENGPG